MSHFTPIGHDIWIGDHVACDQHLSEFELSIHVWRHENIAEHRVCSRVLKGGPGIDFHYREADQLHTAGMPLDEIAAYCSRQGQILIHCAGGVCRAPTFGLVAKIARGCDRYVAIADIYRAMYETYAYSPELYNYVVKDIFRFFDGYVSMCKHL